MKQLVFILFAFCVISNAYAQMDCESIPSCAEMGYTQDSCSGGKGVRCPFDENKFYCAGVKQLPDAPEPVVTPEDWTAECADKINYCTAYNTECQCTACESGYLLSDGACVPECDKSADTCVAENKTFNSANCVCEACPTNYQFNSETKACEQIACDTTKVEHCTTYDSEYEPCTCQACELNYLLVDGICKKMCTKVENCTTYDSEYDPCNCTACEDGFTLVNGVCVDPCVEKCKIAYPLFAGQEDTETIVKKMGKTAYAAYAASQFYVGDKNGDFGQGKWYLPSIGEWLYFYGTDMPKLQIHAVEDLIGDNGKLIDSALSTLNSKGIATDNMITSNWSSTEGGSMGWGDCQGFGVWVMSSAIVRNYVRDCDTHTFAIRCAMLLEDFYNPSSGGTAPKIGDVIYLDKTYGSATNYNGSKMPVGVISSVSTDGRDVTIINLRFLTLHSDDDDAEDPVYYFDPEHPYGEAHFFKWSADYTYISDYVFTGEALVGTARASDNCPCQFYKQECRLNEPLCKANAGKGFNAETCKCIYIY